MKKSKLIFYLMYLILIVVGVLQFFEVPKVVNYICGILSIFLGTIGFIVKFKLNN